MRSSSREHDGDDGTIYLAHGTATASTLVHVNMIMMVLRTSMVVAIAGLMVKVRSSAPPAGLTPSVSESGDDCKGKQGRMLVAVRACWYFFLSVFMYDNPSGNSYYAQHDPFQLY
jgi:hypothetical protein